MRRNIVSALTLAAVMTGAHAAHGATAPADFYRGKVVRIIVGFSAGGGFDTFARTVARYMGKYIPGNPSIIVDNMPGAGSLIAANHIYRVAKPDGLTIGAFNGNQILGQLVGAQTTFDARKMEWVGAPGYRRPGLCELLARLRAPGAAVRC
jgi:tripartite-type tricarboxylate transporter receptor subunit TctC